MCGAVGAVGAVGGGCRGLVLDRAGSSSHWRRGHSPGGLLQTRCAIYADDSCAYSRWIARLELSRSLCIRIHEVSKRWPGRKFSNSDGDSDHGWASLKLQCSRAHRHEANCRLPVLYTRSTPPAGGDFRRWAAARDRWSCQCEPSFLHGSAQSNGFILRTRTPNPELFE